MASRQPVATSTSNPPTRPASPESHESFTRRNNAAEILQSYEKLSWYSYERCESIAQTRLHFQHIIAGFTSEDEDELVDWPEDYSPHPPQKTQSPHEAFQGAKPSSKGKERASLGGASEEGAAGPSSPAGGSRGKGKGGEGGGAAAASGSVKRKKRKSGAGGGSSRESGA